MKSKIQHIKNVAGTMGLISAVIIVFGLAIGILVIYALASMNIDDREREIAVLKLGYYDYDGTLYTSRELLLITVLSSLISCLLLFPKIKKKTFNLPLKSIE